jgi:hypothetical protein
MNKRYTPANAETQEGGGGGTQADLIHFLEVNFGTPEAYVDQTFINTCVDCGLEQYHARWLQILWNQIL